MRIISGRARGISIECPSGNDVRPMLARVRGAVCNIFRNVIAGEAVLDLYAGCGSIGIEALSQGAAWCVFVERDRRARQVLDRNLARTRLAEFSDVIEGDVFRCLPRLKRLGRRFRLVVADPPYAAWDEAASRADIMAFVDSLADEGILGLRPWFVAHHHPKAAAAETTRRMVLDEQRRYGRSLLSIYRLKTEPDALTPEGQPPAAEGAEAKSDVDAEPGSDG